jgi:release factor glutamine methyltransferase
MNRGSVGGAFYTGCMQASTTEHWTTRKLLAWMGEAFTKKGLDSPRLLAELLMAHVLGCERLKLYMDPDRPATPLERATLRDMVGRALKHEPVQYLVGEAWFFGLPFHVDRRVLIPRPCTETIVEHVLQHHRATHGPSQSESSVRGEGALIADVCTGSGAIAIALLKHLPGARCVASDVSAEALEVAAKNAERHSVRDRLDLVRGDLLKAVRGFAPTAGDGSLDYLVSNPPYIPDDEWPDQVDANVRDHEPELALRGGSDGLALVRPLLQEGPALLKAGGLILVEVADSRAEEALGIARGQALLRDVRIVKDHEGLRRVIVGVRGE